MNKVTDPEFVAWVVDHTPQQVEAALRAGIEVLKLQVMQSLLQKKTKSLVETMTQQMTSIMESTLTKFTVSTQDSLNKLTSSNQAAFLPIETQMENLMTAMRKLDSNIKGSSTKGRLGETLVQHNISNYFPDAEIEDTSQKPNLGDIHITLYPNTSSSCSIMVEVKTYDKNVPGAQVEKFQNEFHGQSSCTAAIFVSTTSGIAGNGKLDFEVTKNGQGLMVFLPEAGTNGGYGLIFALHFCHMFMKIHTQQQTTSSPSSSYTLEQWKKYLLQQSEQLERLKRMHNQMCDNTEKNRQTLQKLVKEHQKQQDEERKMDALINDLIQDTQNHCNGLASLSCKRKSQEKEDDETMPKQKLTNDI